MSPITFFLNYGRKGQLGRGTLAPETCPERIPALGGLNIIQIDCGKWHNVALTSEGDLFVWGWNKYGQLGLPCPDFEVVHFVFNIVLYQTPFIYFRDLKALKTRQQC
jgi:alpha-tubulin suppressor-like RCC1 family protein